MPGTSWYHSHTAYQRGDGLFGMYIVRLPPDMEVHSYNYDFDLTEHYIIVQEWFHAVKKLFCILILRKISKQQSRTLSFEWVISLNFIPLQK